MPFPTLMQGNPAPDPGEFTAAAASVRNAMHSAANQQAEQKRLADKDAQAQAQKDFADRIQMAKLGATQDAESSGSTHPNAPTLKLGDQNPDSVTQARKGATIKDPQGGGDWYVPTAEEKATKKAENDPQNFVPTGQLAQALQAGGGWDGKKPLTPTQSHALMQALNLAQPKDEAFDIDTSGKFTDAQGRPAAVTIGKKTGKVRLLDLSGVAAAGAQPSQPGAAGPATPGAATGGPFDTSQAQSSAPGDMDSMDREQSPGYGFSPKKGAPGAATNGPFSFAPPQKDERADTQSILPGQQGPNGGILVFNKDTKSVEEINVPKGSKGVMTAAQTEADKDRDALRREGAANRAENKATRADDKAQKHAESQGKVEESYAKAHEAAGIKKDNMQSMAQGYYDAEGTEPGATYFPPRLVNGIVVPGPAATMPSDKDQLAERRKALHTAAVGFQKTAKTHQDEQKRIEKVRGWGQSAPDGAAPAKPAQPVAAPVATPAAPAAKTKTRQAPPASVAKGLGPGTHTFGNGEVWRKGADGSMVYVSGGQ